MARQTSHTIVAKDAASPKKPARPRDPVAAGERDAAQNRVAGHNYFLLEKFEAGIVLTGTEIKSARDGKVFLSYPRDEVEITPSAADAFIAPFPIGIVKYQCAEPKRCDSFTAGSGRVQNLPFVRVELGSGASHP